MSGYSRFQYNVGASEAIEAEVGADPDVAFGIFQQGAGDRRCETLGGAQPLGRTLRQPKDPGSSVHTPQRAVVVEHETQRPEIPGRGQIAPAGRRILQLWKLGNPAC